MLHGTADTTDEVNRKKPFVLLGNIFKRRREHEGVEPTSKPPQISFQDSDFDTQKWKPLQGHHHIEEENIYPSPFNSPISTSSFSLSPTPSPIRSPVLMTTNTPQQPQIFHTTASLRQHTSQALPPQHQQHSNPAVIQEHHSSTTKQQNISQSQPPTITIPMGIPKSPAPHSPYFNGRSTSPALLSGVSTCASPNMIHHTPLKSRDIGEDMEAIRLSRQDNPYLQKVAGSQATLVDEDCDDSGDIVHDEDTTHLVSSGGQGQNDAALSLEEVHEHLIRSPPPTSVSKTLGGRQFVFFGSDGDDLSDISKTLPSNARGHSLNPLLTKGHEDVLDHHLRQILDTQRKLSVPKEMAPMSSSVPGSPARAMNSTNFHTRKSPHNRTFSEEATFLAPLGSGSYPSVGWFTAKGASSGVEGPLAPLQTHGKKHSVPNEMILNRPLLVNAAAGQPANVASILRPLHKASQFKRSISLRGGGGECHVQSTGSSSSLTLPIRHPHQPAPSSNAL